MIFSSRFKFQCSLWGRDAARPLELPNYPFSKSGVSFSNFTPEHTPLSPKKHRWWSWNPKSSVEKCCLVFNYEEPKGSSNKGSPTKKGRLKERCSKKNGAWNLKGCLESTWPEVGKVIHQHLTPATKLFERMHWLIGHQMKQRTRRTWKHCPKKINPNMFLLALFHVSLLNISNPNLRITSFIVGDHISHFTPNSVHSFNNEPGSWDKNCPKWNNAYESMNMLLIFSNPSQTKNCEFTLKYHPRRTE